MPHDLIIDFSNDDALLNYINQVDDKQNPLRHENYHSTVQHAKEMGIHVEGKSPADILLRARFHEPQEIFDQRMAVYEPITKSEFQKILNILAKIEKGNNFSIRFGKPEGKIPEGESLKEYTEEDFPEWINILRWLFGPALKQIQADPNAVVAWIPKKKPDNDREFLQPIPIIMPSWATVDYSKEVYYTFLVSTSVRINTGGDKTQNIGRMYKLLTDKECIVVTQLSEISKEKTWRIDRLFEYTWGQPPVHFLKGDVKPNRFPIEYESFVNGILPFWNKVIRMDSDLDGQYISHMYLERVEIPVDCQNHCRHNENLGFFTIGTGDDCVKCPDCKGKGFIIGRSPYGVTIHKTDGMNDENRPFPGITYIVKPVEIVELGEKKLDKLILQGFESTNMDIVTKVGDNQSGIAKTIDRSDLDSHLDKQKNNLFDNVLPESYKWISLWRYFELFKENRKKIKETQPVINKPTSFDVVTIDMIANEMKVLKDAGISDETFNALEIDFVDKKYPNDPLRRRFLELVRDLDPMPNENESDKVLIKNSRGTTLELYVVSTNIRPFLKKAIAADDKFPTLERDKQEEILLKLAQELISKQVTPIELTSPNGSPEGNSKPQSQEA